MRASSYNIIGLSATPFNRIDNFGQVAEFYCGKVIDGEELPGYQKNNNKFKGNINVIKYKCSSDYCKVNYNEKTGLINYHEIIQQLIDDPNRFKLVLEIINKYIKLKKNIFVFADRRNYLENIYNSLNYDNKHLTEDYEGIYNIMGGSTNLDLNNAKKNAKVILTTYPYLSTGFSLPRFDCVILSTPRKRNTEQTIGRILRMSDEYKDKERLIVDIIDMNTLCKNQYYERKKIYDKLEFPIKVTKYSYKDFIDS